MSRRQTGPASEPAAEPSGCGGTAVFRWFFEDNLDNLDPLEAWRSDRSHRTAAPADPKGPEASNPSASVSAPIA